MPNLGSGDGRNAVGPPMQVPPELLHFAVGSAERDAEHVAAFLSGLGFSAADGPLDLPADFLIELAVAVRVLSWELQGFDLHRKAGLPSADDAIRSVFLRHLTQGVEGSADAAPNAVLGLTLDGFAWTGPADLQGEVLLDKPAGDSWVDDLAALLWNLRDEPSTPAVSND